MTSRTRKLVGTVILLASLGIYLPFMAMVGSGRLAELPVLGQMAYFLTAGLVWVLPAGFLVRWMQRPDPEGS